MAAESEAILGPEVAARFGRSSSRSASTTSTRSREDTSRSSAIRPSSTRARRSASRTRSTRRTTSCRRPPARRSSSACARTPTWTPSSATRARRSRAGRSSPARHLQLHDAEQHRLYAIPAGTPHASGAGNVVLEISATPYLYTLRFYDWLRRDLEGTLRPVHLEHAFANLDPRRRGEAVRARPRPRSRPSSARETAGPSSSSAGCPSCSSPRTGSTSTTPSRTTPAGGSTCSTWSRARR